MFLFYHHRHQLHPHWVYLLYKDPMIDIIKVGLLPSPLFPITKFLSKHMPHGNPWKYNAPTESTINEFMKIESVH